MTNTQQETTQQFQKVSYWTPLHTFYADKATMSVTLADSDGNVQFKISPVIQGREGRPQAGEAKYDYQNSVAISLSLTEMSAIIMAYNLGSIAQTPATFYHKTQTAGIIGGIGCYEGRYYFIINDQGKGVNHKYFFNFTKFGQQGSEVYIPSELNLFISIIQGVLNSLTLIKSKMIPAYVPKRTNTQQQQQPSFANNQNPVPSFQQPQPAENPIVQPQYTNRPFNQQTQQPVTPIQNPALNIGGLPTSINDQSVELDF